MKIALIALVIVTVTLLTGLSIGGGLEDALNSMSPTFAMRMM